MCMVVGVEGRMKMNLEGFDRMNLKMNVHKSKVLMVRVVQRVNIENEDGLQEVLKFIYLVVEDSGKVIKRKDDIPRDKMGVV